VFRNFISEIANILQRHGELNEAAHSDFIELCRQLFSTHSYRQFFESYLAYLDGPQDWPTGSSLAHENGFIKISLAKFGNDEQLRLHIWPKSEFVDSRAHSHRWNFSSYILSGTLIGMNYSVSALGDQSFFKLYDAVDGLKTLVPHLTGSLILDGSYDVSASCSHYLNFHTIHRVRKLAGSGSLSLMLSGPPLSEYSIVSMVSDFTSSKRTFMDPDQIRQLLVQIGELDPSR